ncbi:MAG: ribonuclease HII [Caulobacteraceae bacterium]|nr:ribonuclease HII [Caulobacteraceae bacterium]
MLLEAACPAPVCGVDEAGRGPLAGPVSAAAVILDPARVPEGLNDSKKLTARARGRLEAEIKASAVAWAVAFATVEEIETLNVLHASGLAMRRAVEALAVAPAFALVDGAYAFELPAPVKTVVGGDGLCCSIAAASILAKTARDRLMVEMDQRHPGYGFADHKGYGAPAHLEALARLGPCPIHRMSWAPIRLLLAGGDPTALEGAAPHEPAFEGAAFEEEAFGRAETDDQHGV